MSEGMSALKCRVYWGSHGCKHWRGHTGPHECHCCECFDHSTDHEIERNVDCVGKPPYYGPLTTFYGEDFEDQARELAREARYE